MNSSSLLLLLLSLLASTTRASLRGVNSLENPFACSLAAADEDSCTKTAKDDDGNPCVWCSFAESGGVCVSDEQSKEISNVVPQVQCSSGVEELMMDPVKVPADFWECLKQVEKEDCTCTWCNTEAGFGVCLADAAARAVEECDFFDCETASHVTTNSIKNPVDVNCLAAGMGSDDAQSVCDATLDSNGSPCVWCDVAKSGYGLCLSSDAAESAGQYLTCDNTENVKAMPNPDDFAECLAHKEEGDCNSETCTWCNTLAGFGMCFSQDAMEIAKMYEPLFNCDKKEEIEEGASAESPLDPTCLAAGFQGDKDSCENTQDQDGNPCVWCDGGDASTGLCLTSDQASIASQWLTCDDAIDIFTDGALKSPTDPTCFAAAFQGDDAEATCHLTNDKDESPCVWCTGPEPTMGVCLTSDQAAVAGQWLTCEDPSQEVDSPLDPTCLAAGFQGDEDSCHNTLDQDGEACAWCYASDATAGICLTSDQAYKASDFLTCEGAAKKDFSYYVKSPMDPTCLAAGYQGDDAEATCHSTNDEDGNACLWCSGPTSGMGVCLSSDQASIAGQWLTCEDPTTYDDEIESPLDPTCLEAGFQGGDKDSCEGTNDQDGKPCVWCDGDSSAAAGMGVCMTLDQASMASQWLTCDDASVEKVFDEEIESPMDPTCLVAGYQADDAETTCHSTDDQDGNACVWCSGPSPDMGVCLSSDQATIAGQWLTCEDTEVAVEMS